MNTMKLNVMWCILVLSEISNMNAQPDPITIEFVEAQPLWEHLAWDTNFFEIGIQPDVNKFTVIEPWKAFRFGSDIVLYHKASNHQGQTFGYILEQLDFKGGGLQWQQFSTYYNQEVQDMYKNLYINSRGNYEMAGLKRFGDYIDLFFGWDLAAGSSSFIRKEFNRTSGTLLVSDEGSDAFNGIAPVHLNFFKLQHDDTFLLTRLEMEEETDEISQYGCRFYHVGEDMDMLEGSPVGQVWMEANNPANWSAYGQPQFIQKLDDNTLICLFLKDRRQTAFIGQAQLVWIDISDIANIRATRRQDIDHLIPGFAVNFLGMRFHVDNGIISLSQNVSQPSLQGDGLYYISWDREGNLLDYFPNVAWGTHQYQDIFPMYTHTEFRYFAARPSSTGRQGLDILKLPNGSGQLEWISSLTSAHIDEQFSRQMEVCQLYDDNYVLIGAYTKKLGEEQNSAVKYYLFDAYDLGMDTAVSTSDPTRKEDTRYTLYPNPGAGCFTLREKNGASNAFQFNLYTPGGILVHNGVTQSGTEYCTFGLEPGLYILNLSDQAGRYLASLKFLII